MKTAEYLAAVKTKLNLSSDYKLAKALKVRQTLVSKWQHGKNVPGPVVAFRIAEILGDQPTAVLADFELERAEKTGDVEEVEEWRGIMQRLGGTAASILLALGLAGSPNADAGLRAPGAVEQSTHRIYQKKRRSGTGRRRRATPWTGLGQRLATLRAWFDAAAPGPLLPGCQA